MLHAANIELFNPLVPKAHNSRAGHFRYFLIFSMTKNDFVFLST